MKKILDMAMRVYVVNEHWSSEDGYSIRIDIGRFGLCTTRPIGAFQTPKDEILQKRLEEICNEASYAAQDYDGCYETEEEG